MRGQGLSPADALASESARFLRKDLALDGTARAARAFHRTAVRLALAAHADQPYGLRPYSYHLRKVREALKRFGFAQRDSIRGARLAMAAWLHDILEDTPVSKRIFGFSLAKALPISWPLSQ